LARFGVDLFTNSEVEEILVGSDRNAIGVKTLSGDQYFAPNIITSFNPKLLNEKVKQSSFRPIYRRRLAEAENTFYKIENYQDIEIENFIYYNEHRDLALGAALNHSGAEGTLSVFIVDNDQNIPTESEVRKNRAQAQLELLEQVVYEKIPVLQGKLLLLDYLKPWSFERYTKTINGSAYSIKQTLNSFGFQHHAPIHGLYLVGQAIYPGFLGSMISSFSLALKLLDADYFWARVINQ
jgi:phytoene dehydrogenase-like protein